MGKNITEYLVDYFPKVIADIIIQFGYKWYGVCEDTINAHNDNIMRLAVLSTSVGEYLVSGSRDSTIKIWDTKTYDCVKTLAGHTGSVHCVAVFSENLIASGSFDGTIKLWNTTASNGNELISTLKDHSQAILSVDFISGKLIVSSSSDTTLKIWNIETKSCVLTLTEHTTWIYSCASFFNNNDNSIINVVSGGGSGDGSIKIWSIKNENDEKLSLIGVQDIIKQKQPVLKVFINPVHKNDIELKVFVSIAKVITVWNIKTFKCENTLHGHSDWIRCIVMLPDGRIISGSDDGKLKIWNTCTNNDEYYPCDITLIGHTNYVSGVVVLSDGRIASCSWDGTIKIWH